MVFGDTRHKLPGQGMTSSTILCCVFKIIKINDAKIFSKCQGHVSLDFGETKAPYIYFSPFFFGGPVGRFLISNSFDYSLAYLTVRKKWPWQC